jgi:flagellar basal-body rod modification protein FlgD
MISSTSSATSSTATAAAASPSGGTNAAAIQDRFLTLLVAQIHNQDPLSPMDNAQMTSQMTQINTVNGIQQLNDTLSSMASQFTSMQMLQGTALVGRSVLTPGATLAPDSRTGQAGGAFDLSDKADNVSVEIVGPNGVVLDAQNMGALPAGRHTFAWDASTYQGAGPVSFRVQATLGAKAIASTLYASDSVASVSSANGSLAIQLQHGRSVNYADIAAIL